MTRHALTCALTAALFATAAVATRADEKEEAHKKEREALQGAWEITSAIVDGKTLPMPPQGKARLTIKDATYTLTFGDMVIEKGTGKVDPSTTPKTAEVTATEGDNKGKGRLAIYELKGDEARACFSAPGGKERPTDFTAKEGSGRTLVTYKRVK